MQSISWSVRLLITILSVIYSAELLAQYGYHEAAYGSSSSSSSNTTSNGNSLSFGSSVGNVDTGSYSFRNDSSPSLSFGGSSSSSSSSSSFNNNSSGGLSFGHSVGSFETRDNTDSDSHNGLSMGRPESGSGSNGSGIVSSISNAVGAVTDFVNAALNPQTYVDVAETVVTEATEYVERNHPVTYGAVQSGLEEANNSDHGGNQDDYERAFYRGAGDFYEDQAIDPLTNIVPAGPIQKYIQRAPSNELSNHPARVEQFEDHMRNLDKIYRENPEVQVIVPGDRNFDEYHGHLRTASQRVASRHTIQVFAPEELLLENGFPRAEGYHGVSKSFYRDKVMGGLNITITADGRSSDYTENTQRHELEHAFDRLMQNDTSSRRGTGSTAEENEMINDAHAVADVLGVATGVLGSFANQRQMVEMLVRVGRDPMTYLQDREAINLLDDRYGSQPTYGNTVTEMIAFTEAEDPERDGISTLRNTISLSTGGLASQPQEAEMIDTFVRRSATFQFIRDTRQNYAELLEREGF